MGQRVDQNQRTNNQEPEPDLGDDNNPPLSRASTLSSTDANYLSNQVNPNAQPLSQRQANPRRLMPSSSDPPPSGPPQLTEQQLNELAGVFAPPAPIPPRLNRQQLDDLAGAFAPSLPPPPPVMRKGGASYQ